MEIEGSYTWKITDPKLVGKIKNCSAGTHFRSPTFRLFNFSWEIELRPNGSGNNSRGNVQILLLVCGLSPNVKKINVWRKYTFVEGNVSHDYSEKITQEDTVVSSWVRGTVTTKGIQKFNQFTFKVDLKLYNVFDVNDEDITNKYLRNDEYKRDDSMSTEDKQLITAKLDSVIVQMEKLNKTILKMQQKINNLELRMDEEQKNDDNDKLWKEIKAIKQTVNKLSLNNNISPQQQKLKSWLENKVKLPQYYNLFVNNGIDELSVVAMIDKSTLKDIGIDTIGHQVKILNYAKQLNNNNSMANEGGPTAYL